MAQDTGHGATLALSGTDTVNGNVVSITGHEETIESIEDTHLGTTDYKTYVPGDLKEPGELQFTILFNKANDALTLGSTAASGNLTLTMPLATGESTNATIVGSGFLTRTKFPDHVTDELLQAEYTFKFDGVTGPTWTKAT